MLADFLKRQKWKLLAASTSPHDARLESWKNPRGAIYHFVVQQAPDARPETIRGRFALAVLEASRRSHSDTSVAVVEAPALSRNILADLEQIASLTPTVSWGALGEDGRSMFQLPGLETLATPRRPPTKGRFDPVLADPFADRGLWVTKILLKRTLHRPLHRDWNRWMSGPTGYFGTYEAFARAAEVSAKTVWQTVHALDALGFVAGAAAEVPLVRIPELLSQIRGVTRAPPRVRPCRWVLPRRNALQELLAGHLDIVADGEGTRTRWRAPSGRMCIAAFGAARAFGLSVTNVDVDEIYVDRDVSLDDIGLAVAAADEQPDILVHTPRRPEAVFRAAVVADGLPTTDIVQTWLDIVDRPERGKEQARRLLEAIHS